MERQVVSTVTFNEGHNNLPLQEFIMRNILSGLCASTLALTFGLASIAPAAATPLFAPKVGQTSVDIQNVQFNPVWRRNGAANRMDQRQGFDRRGDRSYYNGHRGYNEPRRGYRQYNGMWFPAAAFIAGAVIGGAINNQPATSGNAHIEWCSDRYRSYRASDNTFQPNSGPRRQCIPS